MNKDITASLNIADRLVSTRIDLLKANAQTAATLLSGEGSVKDLTAAMSGLEVQYPDFISSTVFSRTGVVAACGDSATPSSRLWDSPYLKSAFAGNTTVSTLRDDAATGGKVFYIYTPLDKDRILAVTISGSLFSNLFSDVKIWDAGNIFILDENGNVVAHQQPDLVKNGANLADELNRTGNQTAAAFFHGIVSGGYGGSGLGYYMEDNKEYLCSYKAVSSPAASWYIGVNVPLSASPVVQAPNILLMLAAIFLAASIVVAIVGSGYLMKPYYLIAKQNRRLEAAEEATRKANESKDVFLANMSHEMRTPLNAIIGLSELALSSGEIGGDTENKIETVHTSGMTLLGIVNDILDISKIEAGKFEIRPVDYAVPSLINDIMALNIMRKGDKPITFSLIADEGLPERFFGDDLRIKQVFNNLLSNAFKYTDAGEVVWRISSEPDEADEGSVWLVSSVEDSGRGIKPEDLKKLFSDYNQVDTKANRPVEGTGLGLSITKHLVEMMDGKIWVDSEYGKGSVFNVRIKQKSVTDVPIGASVASNLADVRYTVSKRNRDAKFARINMSYAHVLVVDDVPANLEVAKGMLSLYHMRIDCAASGMEAIEMVRAENPRYDAVFMDHMMPGMDGIEATRIIREEIGTEYAKKIPVVALTANAISGNEELFLKKGFNAFLSKPINLTELDSILKVWVRDKEREKELPEETPATSGDNASASPAGNLPVGLKIDGIDTARSIERFGGSVEAYLAVLRSYAETTRPILETMKSSLNAGNLPDYAIAVHGIKGSSRGVGAENAAEIAETLEHAAKNGEMDKVRAENGPFTDYLTALLLSISAALAKLDADKQKAVAVSPDPALLQDLREACAALDMDRIDNDMEQLESFTYENGKEEMAWLHDQIVAMNFKEISRRDDWLPRNNETVIN